MFLSSNYFNLKWNGDRRLRNLVLMLDWAPGAVQENALALTIDEASCGSASVAARLREHLDECLQRIPELLCSERHDASDAKLLSFDQVQLVLMQAFSEAMSDVQIAAEFVGLGVCPKGDHAGSAAIGRNHLQTLLLSANHRRAEDGRFFVGVSLAEAETIRRILHARQGVDVIDGATTQLGLRHVGSIGSLLDTSHRFEAGPRFQTEMATQTCRFLDGQFYFSPAQLSMLVKALQLNDVERRQDFFTRLSGCRRRLSRRWGEKPVAKALRDISSEFQFLQQRIQAEAVRLAVEREQLDLRLAFDRADTNKDGKLSAEEVLRLMLQLQVLCTLGRR